jgi:hypothetical protein
MKMLPRPANVESAGLNLADQNHPGKRMCFRVYYKTVTLADSDAHDK